MSLSKNINPSLVLVQPRKIRPFITERLLMGRKELNPTTTSSKNPQIQKLLEKCNELLAYKEIVLCWIPSHIGIQDNEMVDKQAKTSLSLESSSFKISFSNFKPSINKYILEEWQTLWNNSIGNKLFDIKPTIGEHQSVVRNIRKEEVVLARLRLGHTRVTHSY